ncbi:hypothetical protein NNG48_07255 [Enterococcus faecium]|nr:hypothetical protein [Enterococcus faecium]
MTLKDILSILENNAFIVVKTDDTVRPFEILHAYVEDVVVEMPEWLPALVTGVTMDKVGDYVITIVPEEE